MLKPLGTHAEDMLKVMRSANDSLFGLSESGEPRGWAFVVPQNGKKCSWILHLVELSGQMEGKPPSLCIPNLEEMAFLMQSRFPLLFFGQRKTPRIQASSAGVHGETLSTPFIGGLSRRSNFGMLLDLSDGDTKKGAKLSLGLRNFTVSNL